MQIVFGGGEEVGIEVVENSEVHLRPCFMGYPHTQFLCRGSDIIIVVKHCESKTKEHLGQRRFRVYKIYWVNKAFCFMGERRDN